MKIQVKHVILIAIAIIIGYVLYFFLDYKIHGHSTDWKKWKEYTFLFNDSNSQYVDTALASSFVTKNDVYTSFLYIPNDLGRSIEDKFIYQPKDTSYNIVFWEFKHLSKVDIAAITFHHNIYLKNLKLARGEVLNSKSDQRISIHFGGQFEKISIYTDSQSTILKSLSDKNYKGFIGTINRMSFCNERGEHEIFIDYVPRPKYVLFLLYKYHSRFFIIIIDSKYPLNESIINILNLR